MEGVFTQEGFKLVVKPSWRDFLGEGVFVGAVQFIGEGLKHSKVLDLYNGGMGPPSAGLVRREKVAVVGEVTVPSSKEIWTKAETIACLAPTVAEETPMSGVEKGRDQIASWAARAREDGNSGLWQNGPEIVLGFSVWECLNYWGMWGWDGWGVGGW